MPYSLVLHQRVAGGRAGDAHGRVGGQAAAVGGAGDHGPFAGDAANLGNGNAVGGLRLAALLDGVAGTQRVGTGLAGREQDRLMGIFVVGAQDAPVVGDLAATGKGEEMHAVGVHAVLLGLLGGGIAGVGGESDAAGHDRVAPGHQHLGGVAGGHGDHVGNGAVGGQAGGNAVEADTREAEAGGNRRGLHGIYQARQRQAAGGGQHAGAGRALDEAAPGSVDAVDNIADGFIVRRIERHVVDGVQTAFHAILQCCLSGGWGAGFGRVRRVFRPGTSRPLLWKTVKQL